jgi:phosphatidylglycerophosphate synthase
MIDNVFRARLPKFSGPLVNCYRQLNLSPNQLTIIGLFFGAGATVLVALHYFYAAIVVWWLGRLVDGTDGIYARETHQASAFGAFLDIICDMTAYSLMILGFDWAFPEHHLNWMLILLLYVLCITGALALGNLEERQKLAGRDNRGLRFAAGIAEGGETGIAYTTFLLLPESIGALSLCWAAVLAITVLARAILAKSELK